MIILKSKAALLTDIHANDEAFKAILKDIEEKNIKYIFSLGDLVGLGPSPGECVELAMSKNIINIPGNNDYYTFLPLNTFRHFKNNTTSSSYKNAIWTKNQLSKEQIEYLKKMPPSIDITINNKLVVLCHFPCDTRYFPNSVWAYRDGNTGIFKTTNTPEDKKYTLDQDNEGVQLANKKPLFDGKTVDKYDAIIFGHYHFERFDEKGESNITNFYSLNAAGVAIEDNTFYYILSPSKKGYSIKKVTVPFNKNKLYNKLDNIDYPNKSTFEEYIKKR